MTEPVKRYNPIDYAGYSALLAEDCLGVCVYHDDYARLEQECERLLADKAAIDLLNQYIVTAEHPVTGKTAICADSGTLRDCMEAALSAKP